MDLVIISGCSGAGKSCVLHVLEDTGYYCVDNLPSIMLTQLTDCLNNSSTRFSKIAASIDIRNPRENLKNIVEIVDYFKEKKVHLFILYLDSRTDSLLIRYKTTRRKHPLAGNDRSLREAIELERELLTPLFQIANFRIDTSDFSLYQLKDWVTDKFCADEKSEMLIELQSFGFKKGVPEDADFIFDVRCLPNPYWIESIKKYNGLQDPIINFLQDKPKVKKMIMDIEHFISQWVSEFKDSSRAYFVIAIGCTGGKHRSVYICSELSKIFKYKYDNVQLRHRELTANDYKKTNSNK